MIHSFYSSFAAQPYLRPVPGSPLSAEEVAALERLAEWPACRFDTMLEMFAAQSLERRGLASIEWNVRGSALQGPLVEITRRGADEARRLRLLDEDPA